ncbi:helix-turn-helix transcriptional regulator [Amycolatopsis minnesotensis]|uniref:Helix-turn-helix transcriptional regulator n=1 Tax=Amycolatopsis minnesotensis TaxID=337894 RepID=A0ABP5DS73_9PSEU
MVSSGPLRRFGAELKKFRAAAGHTQTTLSEVLGKSQSTINAWERGRTRPSVEDIEAIANELELSPMEDAKLKRLIRESANPTSSWARYNLSESVRAFVALEQEASEVKTYQQMFIPVLLQDEAYIRALHLDSLPRSEVELRVKARIRRQQQVFNQRSIEIHAVIAESVLEHEIGGASVFAKQLEKLATLVQHNTITLQVLPKAQSTHPAAVGAFSIMFFGHNELDPPVAFCETALGGQVATNERDLEFLSARFLNISDIALSPEKTLHVLEKALRKYHRKDKS